MIRDFWEHQGIKLVIENERRNYGGTLRQKEKKREKRDKEKKMSRVNYYYQSAFNSQKEKLDILAEMLKISKTGFGL